MRRHVTTVSCWPESADSRQRAGWSPMSQRRVGPSRHCPDRSGRLAAAPSARRRHPASEPADPRKPEPATATHGIARSRVCRTRPSPWSVGNGSACKPPSTPRSPAIPTWCSSASGNPDDTLGRGRRSRPPFPHDTKPDPLDRPPAHHPDPFPAFLGHGHGRRRTAGWLLSFGPAVHLHLAPPADRAGTSDDTPLPRSPRQPSNSSNGRVRPGRV